MQCIKPPKFLLFISLARISDIVGGEEEAKRGGRKGLDVSALQAIFVKGINKRVRDREMHLKHPACHKYNNYARTYVVQVRCVYILVHGIRILIKEGFCFTYSTMSGLIIDFSCELKVKYICFLHSCSIISLSRIPPTQTGHTYPLSHAPLSLLLIFLNTFKAHNAPRSISESAEL